MRVLFASGIDGFCHRYAVLHWAEQLATQAVASTVRAHTDPRLAADLATHDVLVLYRVPDGVWVRHLLARAGFHVREMFGDFARGPVVDGCPEIIVMADRA